RSCTSTEDSRVSTASVTIASTGSRWRVRWNCSPQRYVGCLRLFVPETSVAPHLPHSPIVDRRYFGWLPCLTDLRTLSSSFATAARPVCSLTMAGHLSPCTRYSPPEA